MTAPEVTLRRAREIWDEREKKFPKFTRQTWEQGTLAARMATIEQARAERVRQQENEL